MLIFRFNHKQKVYQSAQCRRAGYLVGRNRSLNEVLKKR